MWKHPGAHLTIGSLDSQVVLQVVAQYNPKEVAVAKQVPWTQNADVNAWVVGGKLPLHYGANQPRNVTVDLLFDALEDGDAGKTFVREQIEALEELASPIEPGSDHEDLKRAHICVVVWGEGMQNFVCVIESLATKYTMFDNRGFPLRATCTVTLKEVVLKPTYDRPKNRVRVRAIAADAE
jgi:hypothetical protein